MNRPGNRLGYGLGYRLGNRCVNRSSRARAAGIASRPVPACPFQTCPVLGAKSTHKEKNGLNGKTAFFRTSRGRARSETGGST